MTRDSAPVRIRHSRILRDAYGSVSAEAFMIIAVITILLTRTYLEITHFPQVGGGDLHIAHALYGGALMMLALLVGWMFLGFGVRAVAVVIGGVGFGLFLDEVGKFVTKDNDYFYGPASEIMYVLVVMVLVVNRLVRDARRPSHEETLANAAAIAAQGVARGLPDHRRAWALRMVERAEAEGADPATVEGLRMLLESARPGTSRLYDARRRAPTLVPAFFTSARWVPVVAWVLTTAALVGVGFGVTQLILGGVSVDETDRNFDVDRMGIASGILFLSSCITLVLALPSAICLRTGRLWPLKMLHLGALVYTLLGALVDFAQEGFAALTGVALGLFAMAVLSHRIAVRTAQVSDAAAAHGDVLSMPR